MLDDDAIARYARQIVVPGIGAAGQEKLLSSVVLLLGNERGCNQAQLYLRAAGLRVVRPTIALIDNVKADVVVLADATSLDERTHGVLVECGKPICWYVVEENAFTSGVHPAAPLPSPPGARIVPSEHRSSGVHDAAACDAASVACAIVIGLTQRNGPVRVTI
jgi:hypothetical protein